MLVPLTMALLSRYQLHSQEEAKERRHSHAISSGLPEADDQQELPSPPSLPMALVGKGPLTSIGQCPPHVPWSPSPHVGLADGCCFSPRPPPAALTPSARCFRLTEVLLWGQGCPSPPLQGISSTLRDLATAPSFSRGAQQGRG